MGALIKTKDEIKSYFNTTLFVEQTCTQINKDLSGLAEIEIHNKTTTNPLESIINQLIIIFESFPNSSNLTQFIYRVDLPENEYTEALRANDLNQLAFLVVKREAQKIFLRHKFSSNF